MNAKDLAELTDKEILERYAPKCPMPTCGNPIREHADEQYVLDKKPVCSDCYYAAAGELIEQHPIGHPRRHF